MILWLAASGWTALADGPNPPPAAGGEDFGQYLADHQDDLAPFFAKNAEELTRQAIPVLMGVLGWVVIFTMLVGWGVDVVMSRGFAFFFSPAHAEIKRALIYATGRLFLSFLYTCLMAVAIVFSLGFFYAVVIIACVLVLLMLVAFAAQIVWILYLYRTPFSVSFLFYLAVIVVHTALGALIAKPVLESRASVAIADFFDQAVTPKLQAETTATRHELAEVASARNAVRAKVADLQNQISQAQADQELLRKEIVDKKNSDIYVLSRIIQLRAHGDLASAHDQLAAFPGQFPASPLDALAQTQLAQVTAEMTAQAEQKKQEEADAARAEAEARADLLARADKGEVTLSEMRKVLIGKTRDQVSSLLGLPSETASDSWGYRRQMIMNPITNQKFGLLVYFNEGTVQSVDYYRNAGGDIQQ